MKLYHASKKLLDALEPQQAQKSESLSGVPSEELDNAIYFSSDYGYAIAMGISPEGITKINQDKKKIEFENPELFSPDEDIYVYEINTDTIPRKNLKQLEGDKLQYKITDLEIPMPEERIKKIKAREVMDFYELTNWNKEINSELRKPH